LTTGAALFSSIGAGESSTPTAAAWARAAAFMRSSLDEAESSGPEVWSFSGGAAARSSSFTTWTCITNFTWSRWIDFIMVPNMSKPSRCHSTRGSFWPRARRLMPSCR
jgi:hypothetical protein